MAQKREEQLLLGRSTEPSIISSETNTIQFKQKTYEHFYYSSNAIMYYVAYILPQ